MPDFKCPEDIREEEGGYTVTSDFCDAGKRADAFLSEKTGMTRSAVVRLMEGGYVRVCNQPITKKDKVKAGECFVLELPAPEPSEALPEDIPLDIRYEDSDILVVNKPQGMVVHPAPGNESGTLVNALLYHCGESLSGIGGVIRPGIVHRIDKDTGGLLVVAKNDRAHLALAADIKEHKVKRTYQAIVLGNLREDSGTVNAPIGRHPVDRKRMAVIRDDSVRSREAVTHWRVLERYGQFTHVRCDLETGRTHQIRVHMAYIGHPLLGDPVYGGDGTGFQKQNQRLIHGQCLFASRLELTHPVTGENMVFTVSLPEDFQKLIEKLKGMGNCG